MNPSQKFLITIWIELFAILVFAVYFQDARWGMELSFFLLVIFIFGNQDRMRNMQKLPESGIDLLNRVKLLKVFAVSIGFIEASFAYYSIFSGDHAFQNIGLLKLLLLFFVPLLPTIIYQQVLYYVSLGKAL